jgi:hypothetical protein
MALTDMQKLAIKTEKEIKSATRAALKLTTKIVEGKVYGSKRRIKSSNLNVMITAEGRRFIYP